MTTAVPASDLERRKRLRIRLHTDLAIEAHKYEGRTFFVVKDPVSLRYYRLKDNEHFLLQFLDGAHTLEEAQKAYEREYRPERLKLEDLEGFAQQLLTAGLAYSESPRAGAQLYERSGKRWRREWLQVLSNILYIKIPIFDPERLLQKMLGYVGWIFSLWFFALSVLFMLSAVMLVATHFDTFRSKLPNYQEFFSLKTAVYLWIALGMVKVIHEFGHGLSCKVFGGEVHEMGALLMCLSPALYCNVSDAWILPRKWHRIIISAAGIYVELVIAATATFVWWYTPTQPFVNNMALSLMVVCSVSTVVFNANPLMRYDGYYVLADWLEIPNLREKAVRYLKELIQEKCLGMEIPPEEYMELWRKLLFVSYAIVSWVYRWVVTFGILFLFSTFLKPQKLEIIGQMLAVASIASMTVWPLSRLIKGIHKRGRLPDMKRGRVIISASVVGVVVAFICFVPLPISRIRGAALVQAHPDATSQVFLKQTAILKELKVSAGDEVHQGNVLAVFRNPEVEDKVWSARFEYQNAELHLKLMRDQLRQTTDTKKRAEIEGEMAAAVGKSNTAQAKLRGWEKVEAEELTLVAPRDGVIGSGPGVDDIGKQFQGSEQGEAPAVFTIHVPGQVQLCLPLATPDYNQLRESLARAQKTKDQNGQEGTLEATIRVRGLDSSTWEGRIARLDESDMKVVPPMLSSRTNGPVPVKPPSGGGGKGQLVPQTQHYTVYIDIIDADTSIAVGAMAQVKVYCPAESCVRWAWRKVNNMFNLRLL